MRWRQRCSIVAGGAVALVCLFQFETGLLASDDQLIYSQMLNNGWQDWGWVPHYATNYPASGGSNCMVFAASSNWQAWWLVHDPVDTTLYSGLTLWLNGGSTGGQTVGIQVEVGSTWGTQRQVKAPTNSWQQFIFPLASLGVANVTNLTGIQIWNNSVLQPNFYISGITLVAAPPPAIVHVGVDAAQTVRIVDSRVFGINTAAWDGYLDTPSTVSVLANMNNQALRWPGGSWGDGYHWANEAWMDGATSARNWGSFTTNFIHVATNTHAQVFMIANYGSSTPEEAAFGVRMCNVTNHAAFKYWEIGNEVGGSWETDENTNAPWQPHDPWTYAQRFTQYYDQMKAVDPTIKIGAVADTTEDGTANYTNHPVVNPVTGVTHNGWTPVMLTYMRSNNVTPDFLICHDYAPGDGDLNNLLWTKTWASNAANLRQMLNDYLGTNAAANVELDGTEFGPAGDKQRVSLVGGLFYADMIGQILQTEFNALLWWDLRNGQSAVADSDNALYGWRTNSAGEFLTDGGCINGYVLPPDFNCYPVYYCMELMKYFARAGDSVVAVTNDCELLGTYAVKRANGGLSLLVINKSSSATLSTAVSLDGYEPSTNAMVYSYGIPQDDAAATGIGSMDVAQTNFPAAGAAFNYAFPPYSATVLSLTPAAPQLALSTRNQPGQIVLQLQGQAGVPYVVQNSPDLVNWTSVSTNLLTSSLLDLTNSISTASPQQFWRAVWRP